MQLILFLLICLLNVVYLVIAQRDEFGFPEEEPVKSQQNKDNRKPLYIPGRCPPNQLLYPGDQKDDWICDCGPGYLYYPAEDGCYAAYRKGPCAPGQYLILKEQKVIPECVTNPCKQDKMVMFKGKCQQLGANEDACKPLNKKDGIDLGVNATTLEIECLPPNYLLSIFVVPGKECPKGSKRTSSGQCRPVE